MFHISVIFHFTVRRNCCGQTHYGYIRTVLTFFSNDFLYGGLPPSWFRDVYHPTFEIPHNRLPRSEAARHGGQDDSDGSGAYPSTYIDTWRMTADQEG